MPPKKKGRKRPSTESDKSKDGSEDAGADGGIDLLSPSEVVKMRKKSNQESGGQKEKEKEIPQQKDHSKPAARAKPLKGSKGKDNNIRATKDSAKKRDKSDKEGAEKEQKKSKGLRDRKKSMNKKTGSSESEKESVLYPCGICTKEVCDTDEAILCEAGCEIWYHRMCTGMTDIAYQLLTNEENAEWVCDKCIATKCVPLTKVREFVNPV